MDPIAFDKKLVIRFSNSNKSEQDLVRRFFNNKSDGFYVDIGANHPFDGSQTWHLEQLGWDGLLIEPLDQYCTQLREKRKGRTIQVACSSPKNHGARLQMIVAGGHSTLNSSLIDPAARRAQSLEHATVEYRTLDSVLIDNSVQRIDFMSIDIEGHEMEMFAGFTIDRWKPTLILLEDHVLNHAKHNFMTSHGYQLILRTGINSWYVPVTQSFNLTWGSKFERFRKYWLGLPGRKLKYGG